MGIMWGEVASSALERVGENVSADLERARSRRQAIIDASVQDMFTSGKEAFAKRKLEREGIQDNIKYFQSMGFDRDTTEQLVSLSSTEIDKLKIKLEDGQKFASIEEKREFDPYASINLPDPNDTKHSVPLSVNFAKNMSKEEQISAMSNVSQKERKRLFEKAKELGIEVPDFTMSPPLGEDFEGYFQRQRDLTVQALLAVQRMEQVEESQTSDYDTWEDSVFANIIGKIDHTKFPDSKAEKSFGDNFRTELRDNFGWAGGEQEEALRQAALLFPGKSAAELRSVLDPTLYERPETIVPPEYEIGYTKAEELALKTSMINMEDADLRLKSARRIEEQTTATLSSLREKETDENIRSTMFPLSGGRLASGTMTYGQYKEQVALEASIATLQYNEHRKNLSRQTPVSVQTRIKNNASIRSSNLTGAEVNLNRLEEIVFKSPASTQATIGDKVALAATGIHKEFDWTGDTIHLETGVSHLSQDLTLWLVFKQIQQASIKGDEGVRSLVSNNFSNISSIVDMDKDGGFTTSIGKVEATKALLRDNIDALIALDGRTTSVQEGINELREHHVKAMRNNIGADEYNLPLVFTTKGQSDDDDDDDDDQDEPTVLTNLSDVSDQEINEILKDGVNQITNKIRENSRLTDFIRETYPHMDLGKLQEYIELPQRDSITTGNLMSMIREYAESR